MPHLPKVMISAAIVAGFAALAAYCWHTAESASHPRPVDMTIPKNLSERKLLAKDFDLGVTPEERSRVANSYESLRVQLREYIEPASAMFPNLQASVALVDFRTGSGIGINDDAVMPNGSLIKIPIMIAALKKSERDPAFRLMKLAYRGELENVRQWDLPFFHPSPERLLTIGSVYSLDDLLYKMIAFSSNRSAVGLYKFVADDFKSFYKDTGLPEYQGAATAKADLKIISRLFNANYLSEESSRKALYLLSKSNFKGGLQAGLPAEVSIAHKFGTNQDDHGLFWLQECGIVYSTRPYGLCVYTQGRNLYFLSDILKTVSKMVYTAQNK